MRQPTGVNPLQAIRPLVALESRLQLTRYLLGDQPRLADIAIFPFVRQFAGVDPVWWEAATYPALRAWLAGWAGSQLFESVMQKHEVWTPA